VYEMLYRFAERLNRNDAAKMRGSSWWSSSVAQRRNRAIAPARSLGRRGKNGMAMWKGTEIRMRENRLSGCLAT